MTLDEEFAAYGLVQCSQCRRYLRREETHLSTRLFPEEARGVKRRLCRDWADCAAATDLAFQAEGSKPTGWFRREGELDDEAAEERGDESGPVQTEEPFQLF
jgi:hypothetical protein